ncbi:hypothetical protein [Xanthobacter autotrophicus]|uniref:hypothetical protein n=1 Tax=Xanthobacter autotrophicus TaxID=280 RepID=UPI0024A79D26|nr:hypothetical protein [Xanthobacter autotrophicus]MDI4655491.1 hypothetical protein [Xanthobacter autotrophicus]
MQLRTHHTRFARSRAQVPEAKREWGVRRPRTALLASATTTIASTAIALAAAAGPQTARADAACVPADQASPDEGSQASLDTHLGTSLGTNLAATWSDAGALILSDGRRFVPEGIALPSRLASDAALPRAAERAVQTALQSCLVRPGAGRMDRHGRWSAAGWLSCPARHDLAEEDLATALLRAGAGYAQPTAQDGSCLPQRLAAETQTRAARRGIWAEPSAVAPAADEQAMAIHAGLFTVAEGRVLAAGGTQDRIFLNFGSSWRQDFTAMMEREDFATIMGDSLEPAMLRGTLVRVRGVVRAEGGPAMMLRQPGEIALLAGTEARAVRAKRGGE